MIDLRSDTATKPTDGMRAAMANAEVGDEQKREDPTVNELERRVAELLGQDEAVYLPTATMANQIACRILTAPGDELLAEENAHILLSEQGGPAAHSGLVTRPIRTAAGLDRESLPMRLYQKAKRLGVWDPYAIDLSRDRADWLSLTDVQREALLQLTSLFQAGEESVTLDLLPLLLVVAREAAEQPELLKEAPHGTPVGRLDEVKAAKRAIVRYRFEEHPDLSAEPAAAGVEAPKGA